MAATIQQLRPVYTVEQAAEVLSVSRAQMYELLRAEAIASFKVGRLRRISGAALARYVTELEAAGIDH